MVNENEWLEQAAYEVENHNLFLLEKIKCSWFFSAWATTCKDTDVVSEEILLKRTLEMYFLKLVH